MAKKGNRRCDALPVLHPDAAGIDVGASELYVAVSADRDSQPIRSFPTFTRDLHALADWLEQCGIHSAQHNIGSIQRLGVEWTVYSTTFFLPRYPDGRSRVHCLQFLLAS